ncbi:MAG: IS1595 family transposase [Polyangia bacterium]
MTRFQDEEAARGYFEQLRWPNGRICPHCGNCDQAKIYERAETKTSRAGLYKCGECAGSFTVTLGTVMEDSHIPLHKWLWAFYLMCASKTQISALQLQRQLKLGSYRTAWFMCHRIRYALMEFFPKDTLKGTVEADETYIGGKAKGFGRGYVKNKTPVVSLVERGGKVRSQVMPHVTGEAVTALLRRHVATTSALNTDESPLYTKAGKDFASHDTVNHKREEYSRIDKASGRKATTNTVEGYFGNSKRSIDGTHHHIGRDYTGLYFAELDHKYNTRKLMDGERTVIGIKRMEGKRLTLKAPRASMK